MSTAHRRGGGTVIGPYAISLHSTTDGHQHAVPPDEFLAGWSRRLYHAQCGHEVHHSPIDAPDFPPPCDECLLWWYAGLREQ